ncbi:NitT/TauT family transport system substrate-binding protein [Rhodoligotrophos appendicifer]|uniref:ABC transporter substrate-binding protein n=1 Tax=Rhodoligotrophos appendicifer TaxID=987056 RepID=UPI001186065D|nr:ABC transporter substrate-binding protein [Rhodoligotrophos appendicifer]
MRGRWTAAFLTGLVMAVGMLSASVQAETKFTVQTGAASPGMFVLNQFVADQAGFFKEEGLDVSINYSQGGPLATQIVASGGADIGDVTFEGLMLGYSKGLRGKFIYSRYNQLIYFMAVAEDSPIKSVKDFAGKKIGVASMGSASLIIAKSILRDAGVEVTADMFLPVGIGDSAVAALKADQVQALSLIDFAYAGLERSGQKFRYFFHPAIAEVGNGGYLVTDETLANRKDLLVKYLKCLVKAHIFIQTNPEAAVRMYWKANPAAKRGATEAEAMQKGLEELKFRSVFFSDPPGGKLGAFNIPGVEKYVSVLKQEGVIAQEIPVKDFIWEGLIDEVNTVDPAPIQELARNWK